MRIIEKLRGALRHQGGLSTVEYTVLLVLIMAASVATWNTFGTDVHSKLKDAKGRFGDSVTVEDGE